MVVPYNPDLFGFFLFGYLITGSECHINIEYCGSIMSIKYIYKYLHNGYDKALIGLKKTNCNEVYNEIIVHTLPCILKCENTSAT